jgi:long-chain acyl-CoA synthetase
MNAQHSVDPEHHGKQQAASPTAPGSAALSRSPHEDVGTWSVAETMSGKHVLVTGATGFLAKVYVVMLLRYHPDIAQLYLLVRGRSGKPARDRFQRELVECGAFTPLHEIWGDGLQAFLDDKVTVISGDITDRYLGMSEEDARALSSKLDLFVNSAGLTNFNPNLESALTINTLSTYNLLEFIALGDNRAAMLHVSTAFVAGNTKTPTPEIPPSPTVYPRYDEVGAELDVDREIADCKRIIDHVKLLAEDQERSSLFFSQARDAMRKRNLDPGQQDLFKRYYDNARDEWIKRESSRQGRERAAHWGWPNIYTYSKSMGERLICQQRGKLTFTLFRPAIIESAESFPVIGWNEGVNTSAPIIYVSMMGQGAVPCKAENSLDIIPVDMVCGSMISIGAGLIRKRAHEVYHSGSSDQNRLSMHRVVELTALSNRKMRDQDSSMPALKRLFLNAWETVPVSRETYERQSAPAIKRGLAGLRGAIDKLPTKSMGAFGSALKGLAQGAKGAESALGTIDKMFEIFMPFINENCYTFIARNIDALCAGLSDEERRLYGSPIADLNWRIYWLESHVPGLQKYVFPELEKKLAPRAKEVYTYQDLQDLFNASTANFAERVAVQHHSGQITERYTYRELGERALRAAAILSGMGVAPRSAVLLASENRPQWSMAYFGIIKAHGTPVPLDPRSKPDHIARVAASSGARHIIVSDAVAAASGEAIAHALHAIGHAARVISYHQLFTLQLTGEAPAIELDAATEAETETTPTLELPEGLGALVYTAGTTGAPKGVMLTQQNMTTLLASMQQVFSINERDGFLSVLPLHHAFELTCGMLMPLSRGASITTMDAASLAGEDAPEQLARAMKHARVTTLVGAPALWQGFFKEMDRGLRAQAIPVQWLQEQILRLNHITRNRYGVNLGPIFFSEAHSALGGRLRYLISGAGGLPHDVNRLFHGLGFNLHEGYGLTEAAPVLTVSRPGKDLQLGSVGKALPGVELAIHNPDDAGVGEVIARGKNIMLGYVGQAPDAVRDGWLFTGDLGKLDRKGRLTLMGRKDEVIRTADGLALYPDKLEDHYGGHPLIEELCIVGLPDGQGDTRIAALVRPVHAGDPQQLAEIHADIRAHLQVEGTRIGAHSRIQVLRFTDEPLPRTATHQIWRAAIGPLLQQQIEAELASSPRLAQWVWLDALIAELAGLPATRIYPSMHLQDDLGFDSLMVLELGAKLGDAGHTITPNQIASLPTVSSLRDFIAGANIPADALVHIPSTMDRVPEYDLPAPVIKWSRDLLLRAQRATYKSFYKVEVIGKANIPLHDPRCIVVANHSSHLDMGLVKTALGGFGKNLRALAAVDYFYKNPVRKTYFNNLTNFIPMERSGTLESSLSKAVEALDEGETVLVFPEGTRSRDGKIQPFRQGVGYLADVCGVNILPVYIDGSFRAYPKGQALPNPLARKLKVYIGEPILLHTLEPQLRGLDDAARYEKISQVAQEAVERLRDLYIGGKGRKQRQVGPAIQPLFHALTNKFTRDQIGDRTSFYFTLGNEDDHKWTVVVDAASCHIHPGKPQGGAADCVIKTTPEVFRRMVQESYIPSFDEFMDGTIRTSNPELLMRFPAIFSL